MAEEPELIRAHLKARGNDNAEMLASVEELGELNKERAALVREGDMARADRKRLSAEIGGLLKAKDENHADAVAALKAEVATANEVWRGSRALLGRKGGIIALVIGACAVIK